MREALSRGWIGLGQSVPTVGEEDYVGAARSIRAMVDVLGPVAALCLGLGDVAPPRIVRPYNRMRDRVMATAIALLGEARSFIESQSLFWGVEGNWRRMLTRLEPSIAAVFVLPRIRREWSWRGPAGALPSAWREAAPASEPFSATLDRVWNELIEAGLAGRMPSVRPGHRWIFLARYGSGGASLEGGGKGLGWIGTVFWITGAWEFNHRLLTVDFASRVSEMIDWGDITPAIDRVTLLRQRFEASFVPAIYQPIRAAALAAEAAGTSTAKLYALMAEANPEDQPAMPVPWDGTFGFGAAYAPAVAEAPSSWVGPILVGVAGALVAMLIGGGD